MHLCECTLRAWKVSDHSASSHLSWLGLMLAMLSACSDVTSSPASEKSTVDQPLATPLLVQTVRVGKARLARTGAASGRVQPFRVATVAAEVGGRVIERLVEPGDEVEAGALLLHIDPVRAELAVERAKAELAARQTDLDSAKHDLNVGQSLFARAVISEDDLKDRRFARDRAAAALQAAKASLATAERALADTEVKAPFAGSIELVHAQVGDYLNPGAPVATLADFGRARIVVGVTAAEAASLAPGYTATLTFEALGGSELKGSIKSVGRMADARSGTYPVEVWLAGDATRNLREGMIANVLLPLPSAEAYPIVPAAALFREHDGMNVYVVENDRAYRRVVRIGRSDGDRIEVRSGVSEGEWVVVDGQFALRDGAPVLAEEH